jgi:hypothetical protein
MWSTDISLESFPCCLFDGRHHKWAIFTSGEKKMVQIKPGFAICGMRPESDQGHDGERGTKIYP